MTVAFLLLVTGILSVLSCTLGDITDELAGAEHVTDDLTPAPILKDDNLYTSARQETKEQAIKAVKIPLSGSQQKAIQDAKERYEATQIPARGGASWHGHDLKDSVMDRPMTFNFPGLRSDKTTIDPKTGKHQYTRENRGGSKNAPADVRKTSVLAGSKSRSYHRI